MRREFEKVEVSLATITAEGERRLTAVLKLPSAEINRARVDPGRGARFEASQAKANVVK